ncbi:polysaccharide biosynthesis/export family protein [Labrys portucalensis]|uniref:Polysaccharide biosynthesis/export family protein n=1 Tax=Labrys neptuniae TaxID=376174 RepID=A0ABV6ZQH1_9HYPH
MKPMSCLAAAGISLCLVLQAGAQTRTGYKLQPGDVLELTVVGLPDFRYKSVIDPDGMVVLPMMRPAKVAGLDLEVVLARVKEDLSRKLYQQRGLDGRENVSAISPDAITLTIAEYRPIYLNGDVTRPGQQTYQPGLTVRQAVALAGGYEIMRFRAENLFLKSADLRNDYQTQWLRYVQAQSQIWRLRLELARIQQQPDPPRSLEEMTQAPLPQDQLDELRNLARQQLELDMKGLEQELGFLRNAVKVADDQIGLLDDRKSKDAENVSADAADYKKLKDFSTRGVVPMDRLSESRRLYLYSSTQALQTTVQLTNVTRERDEAERNVGRYVEKRRIDMLKGLEAATASLAEAQSQLQSVSEQLTYTGIIRSQLVRGSGAKPIITIFHSAAAGGGSQIASEDSPVQPGDTIEVALAADVPAKAPAPSGPQP